jgi:transcription elongation factor GreA
MSDQPNSISPEGKAAAEAELKELTEVRRPEIVQAIKTAREFGDLSENAEYHAAREDQGMNEARIKVLEHHLSTAVVVEDAGAADGSVALGSKVSFRDAASEKVTEATLVHPLEASLPDGKLSSESPVARALLGHKKGETVAVETPNGSKKLEILEVG